MSSSTRLSGGWTRDSLYIVKMYCVDTAAEASGRPRRRSGAARAVRPPVPVGSSTTPRRAARGSRRRTRESRRCRPRGQSSSKGRRPRGGSSSQPSPTCAAPSRARGRWVSRAATASGRSERSAWRRRKASRSVAVERSPPAPASAARSQCGVGLPPRVCPVARRPPSTSVPVSRRPSGRQMRCLHELVVAHPGAAGEQVPEQSDAVVRVAGATLGRPARSRARDRLLEPGGVPVRRTGCGAAWSAPAAAGRAEAPEARSGARRGPPA